MLSFYIFLFILGTVVGSFLNVIIVRLRTKELIIKNRSHCPFCKKELAWYELIPVVSFIIQLGKCRHCGKRISLQYPLVELATGLLFVAGLNYESGIMNFDFLFLLVISCFLIILFVYDLKHYLVPDKIIYSAIVLTFGFRILDLFRASDFGFRIWLDYFIAAIIGGAFFLVIVVASKGKWMGMGDVKIGILMGLLLGFQLLIVALFLAFLIGAVISIILLILKKKKLKSEIPFGPFLVGATFISLFWGEILIGWYFNLFV